MTATWVDTTAFSTLLWSCVVMSDPTFAFLNYALKNQPRTAKHEQNTRTPSFAHLESCFLDKPTEMVYQHCTIRDSYDMENQKRFAEEKELLMGWTGEYIFSRAKHHERAIIPVSWQMRRMVHLYGTSFSNLPSDNKPESYFIFLVQVPLAI